RRRHGLGDVRTPCHHRRPAFRCRAAGAGRGTRGVHRRRGHRRPGGRRGGRGTARIATELETEFVEEGTDAAAAYEVIAAKLGDSGDGAAAIVLVEWADGRFHTFTALNDEDIVRWVDPLASPQRHLGDDLPIWPVRGTGGAGRVH